MKYVVSALAVSCTILLVLASGCADVNVKQKVGDFGTAFGTSSEEQKAIDWFTTTYGDPRTNNDQSPRFIEPLITTGVTDKNMPVDKVTVFPVSGGSVYFWVIYDNFKSSDPITITWTYMENGKVVTTVDQNAGGDFGRFIAEFEKPDTGWGKGNQKITVSGRGTSAEVTFTIGDTLQTTALPYNPSGTASTGTAIVNPAVTRQPIAGATLERSVLDPRLGGSGIITPTTTSAQPIGFQTVAVTAVGFKPGTTLVATLPTPDLKTNPLNCGTIGNVCRQNVLNAQTRCNNGFCTYSCISPYDYDDQGLGKPLDPNVGCNLNTNTDPRNCGRAGIACQGSEKCQEGTCVSTCSAGISSCGYSCVNLKTDINNCGSCGHKCSQPPHTVVTCVDSQCSTNPGKPLICLPGWDNCDGNNLNGCESQLIWDFNCGSCGNECHMPEICLWDINDEANAHCGLNLDPASVG